MNTVRQLLESKGREVFVIKESATIDDAVIEMCRVKVGALVVVDDAARPVGMISERDLLIRVLLAHRDPAHTLVREVMTHKIVCVNEEDTLESAMSLMTHERCRHLPVARGGIVGLISIGDLVRAAHGDHEYELRVLHEYIEGRYPG